MQCIITPSLSPLPSPLSPLPSPLKLHIEFGDLIKKS